MSDEIKNEVTAEEVVTTEETTEAMVAPVSEETTEGEAETTEAVEEATEEVVA